MSSRRSPSPPPIPTLRKTKSTETFLKTLRRKASIGKRLGRRTTATDEHPSLRPESPSTSSIHTSGFQPPVKKRRWVPGRRSSEVPPPLPPQRPSSALPGLEDESQFFELDTDVTRMDGIIDPQIIHSAASSPDSGLFTSNSPTLSVGHSHSQIFFSNPWVGSTDASGPTLYTDPVAPNEADFKTPDSWHTHRPKWDSDAEASSDDEQDRPSRVVGPRWKIKVYGPDHTEHLLRVSVNDTVASLMPQLNAKLPPGEEKETHELYLRQWGTERKLRKSERPANILRRCYLQAGYDETDGYDLHGGGVPFLFRFVYRSQFLGTADDTISSSGSFVYTNLTGRSLTALPILLHQHAPSIHSLILSRNPLGTAIPSDFLQACTALHQLTVTHMYLRKVPRSIRGWRSKTLTQLDLSANRLVTLNGDDGEIWLHEFGALTSLQLQNNRLDGLPTLLPLGLLELNLSNNRFTHLPLSVTHLPSLTSLDISHNALPSLPAEIGQLGTLTKLIMACNHVTEIPSEFLNLRDLQELDCRRNNIGDLGIACALPQLITLTADHNNNLHGLALNLGPNLQFLDLSHNEITELVVLPGPVPTSPFAITSLDMSYTNLSVLPSSLLPSLPLLRTLLLHHNALHNLPSSLSACTFLETLSVADNHLKSLPSSIGFLQKLEVLDVHGNSLTELPRELWECASLAKINATSNLLRGWWDPPPVSVDDLPISITTTVKSGLLTVPTPSSPSRHSFSSRRPSVSREVELPPLVHSLEALHLAENELTDEALLPMLLFKELRVLNLSLNDIQEVPPDLFVRLDKLEEVYLSGNRLTRFPSEGLGQLQRLGTLFLNGNRLSHLPSELGKVKSLTLLDVGNNLLKYNINNLDYDWNWNFNQNLVFLNLSGNKQLEIKSDASHHQRVSTSTNSSQLDRRAFSGFSALSHLRLLGLMDVTITTNTGSDIPDEDEERRVRTSSSLVNGLSYGIADTIGRHPNQPQHTLMHMVDLVHEFRGAKRDTVFAMFGRALPLATATPSPTGVVPTATANSLAKYLRDHFIRVFNQQLNAIDPHRAEGVPDALRRTFLKLNQEYHDSLFGNSSAPRKMSIASLPSPSDIHQIGASAVVVYIVAHRLYVANVGNALAVISRDGTARRVSRKHAPYDLSETIRIKSTGGWVSPSGLVSGELDISRSFGFYHLMPSVNARPDVCEYELNSKDEFIIIANRGLWDFIEPQTAVDIVQRSSREPMVAAQNLRDLAMSCGAEGSTMIMVVSLANMFKENRAPAEEEEQIERYRKRRGPGVLEKTLDRLRDEVPAPIGNIAVVFTDIQGSTHLWEATQSGMIAAIHLHNTLLRRYLRHCGGYEVRTEGDSFMCTFPTVLAAVWWCLMIQVELLGVSWPQDILECPDGSQVLDSQDNVIYRGLRVRMGIHCGAPSLCLTDPVTGRMDYFGLVITRASRISSIARGGEIMCSADAMAELNAHVLESEPSVEYPESPSVSKEVIHAIRALGPAVVPVGEVKLKGLEAPETLSYILPQSLAERRHSSSKDVVSTPVVAPLPIISISPPVAAIIPPAPIQRRSPAHEFNTEHIRALALLCVRLEFAVAGRPYSTDLDTSQHLHVLLPTNLGLMTETELLVILESLAIRMENLGALLAGRAPLPLESLVAALRGLDERTFNQVLSSVC
ncbi:Adenylate cyclase [Mycena indigotica]|uniref:Adenylate cyclase n=1 Tax=Mycena indigotica TaxID=2126181 RepID=A0A8H6TAR8_9AGAR|nr:Adenylate cyclase [Mycena indigotica]KAF7312445.1 Adenylate cyclase [Mycena indigotica]